MVVVEVRQGTLSMDGRGWGPTENTVDRGSQLDEEDEDDEDDKEDEEEEEEEEEKEKEEEEKRKAADIKSNNPHLAGGEKHQQSNQPSLWCSQMQLLLAGKKQTENQLWKTSISSNYSQTSRCVMFFVFFFYPMSILSYIAMANHHFQ